MNLNATPSASPVSLIFSPERRSEPLPKTFVVGRPASLTSASVIHGLLFPDAENRAAQAVIGCVLADIEARTSGTESVRATAFLPDASRAGTQLTVVQLPPAGALTRNNHPFSPHALSEALIDGGLLAAARDGGVRVVVLDEEVESHMGCAAAAISRALPLYCSKTKKRSAAEMEAAATRPTLGVFVSFHNQTGEVVTNDALCKTCNAVAEGVRLAARLGDMPPAELNPDTYAAECQAVVRALVATGADVSFSEVKGEALREGGYGGIYGVGMAGMHPPRMIVLRYTPGGDAGTCAEHVVLCGKGVVYDTGGLSLKPKVGMCGMKHDMGGSAGVLGAFMAAATLRLPRRVTAILAIVENAIGPNAVRNDDILTMKSGRTVEINNTDAEGRLILADCVSHASNSLDEGVDVILDMATLTGAQLVTTGKKHAGILAKTKRMEERVYNAGLRTGDLVFPML